MAYNRDTMTKTVLGVGFITLAAGIIAAYSRPAHQYELSVYSATPTTFWAGLAIAFLIAMAVALFARDNAQKVLGLVLGGGCFTAFVGLPLLRGYHYYGTADALTHLGWMQGIVDGEESLLSLLYPGIHTVAAFVQQTTGFESPRAMLYVVLLFAVLFVIFTGLAAWALTHDLRTTGIAAFSAAMLLPITNISSQLVAHTTTQAILFLPVVLYLLIRYMQSERDGLRPTGAGVLLAVTLVALVLYHPQQSLNLLAMFGAIAAGQFVVRNVRWQNSLVASTRPVYFQTAILAAAFTAWSPGHSRFDESFGRATDRIRDLVTGGGQIGGETAQRGDSLSEIGSGLLEVYLKTFGVTTVYCVIAGGLLLAVFAGKFDRENTRLAAFGRLLAVGLVVPAGIFLLYLLGDFGEQSFRHLGFILVFVTVLGAVGLASAWDSVSGRLPAAGPAVALILVVGIVVSAVAVFPSPWMFLHSQHVTEMQMDGYETSFDHADGQMAFYGVRQGPHRYADVYNNGVRADRTRFRAVEESAMLTDLSDSYGDGWYFALTRVDRQREVNAYRGLRYSDESFDAAGTQRGVNRIIDNGDFELYFVTG